MSFSPFLDSTSLPHSASFFSLARQAEQDPFHPTLFPVQPLFTTASSRVPASFKVSLSPQSQARTSCLILCLLHRLSLLAFPFRSCAIGLTWGVQRRLLLVLGTPPPPLFFLLRVPFGRSLGISLSTTLRLHNIIRVLAQRPCGRSTRRERGVKVASKREETTAQYFPRCPCRFSAPQDSGSVLRPRSNISPPLRAPHA